MRSTEGIAALALAALTVAGCSERVDPDEHLADKGEWAQMRAVCPGDGAPDLAALERAFDRAHPMTKGFGYSRAALLERIANAGGVLLESRGRRYHSRYMVQAHLWNAPDERVYGYAVLVDRPGVIFVESQIRSAEDFYFFPWLLEGRHEPRPCR